MFLCNNFFYFYLDCHVHLYLGVWFVVMETKVLQLEVLNVGHWSGDLQLREGAGPPSQLDKRIKRVHDKLQSCTIGCVSNDEVKISQVANFKMQLWPIPV